jgi:hypothetical protein
MNKLKQWQTKNNVTNKMLSAMVMAKNKKLRCGESMVSHYHAKRKNFSPLVAFAITDITGVDPKILLTRAKPKRVN